MSEHNHAIANAKGWAESILELYNAYNALNSGEESVKVDGQEFTDESEIIDHAYEMPLEISVRSDWHTPGEDGEATEFQILLSTGGPALRIFGQLGRYQQPQDETLQWQDWGTPWTCYTDTTSDEDEAIEWFANLFCFESNR